MGRMPGFIESFPFFQIGRRPWVFVGPVALTCVCVFESGLSTIIRVSLIVAPDKLQEHFRNQLALLKLRKKMGCSIVPLLLDLPLPAPAPSLLPLPPFSVSLLPCDADHRRPAHCLLGAAPARHHKRAAQTPPGAAPAQRPQAAVPALARRP